MSYKESDIHYEQGEYWVLDTGETFAVMQNTGTHSVSDSEYPGNDDGRSIAIARCKYLAKSKAR